MALPRTVVSKTRAVVDDEQRDGGQVWRWGGSEEALRQALDAGQVTVFSSNPACRALPCSCGAAFVTPKARESHATYRGCPSSATASTPGVPGVKDLGTW